MPLILSAPHGGQLRPRELTDRELGSGGRYDVNTQELVRTLASALHRMTGYYPHVIINRLSRVKLDANREALDAAGDDSLAAIAWEEYHNFIDSARSEVGRKFGRGLYIDLHGHRHIIQQIELGYLIPSHQLRLSEDSLNLPSIVGASSIRSLADQSRLSFSELVRGKNSFGALLERRGYKAVPSNLHFYPEGKQYFSGGYSIERHSSFSGGVIDGIQVETPMRDIRESEKNIQTFANVLADVIIQFLNLHYHNLPVFHTKIDR